MRLLASLKLNATVAVTAYILSYIYNGGFEGLPEMLLLVKLNVFALPLAVGTSLFEYPLWCWYVVVLLWVLQGLHYSGLGVRDFIDLVFDTG